MNIEQPSLDDLRDRFPQLDILELLGRGGMGVVYKARQKHLDRFVAVKILPPGIGDDPAFAERFTREAKALAKLNHPNIVTLYEFGQADGLFYFIMEFVDGLNLRQLINAGRITPREALAIVPQICDALQYAHDAGIVHRDIKPENILLDRRGHVKVADFGLAKLVRSPAATGLSDPSDMSDLSDVHSLHPEITAVGKVVGTPQYMAPEQVEHPGEVDHRADIYSLGVVFYQMLTGELPARKLEAPSSRMRGIVIDVRLDEVVLRALEKEPERRYQTATDFKTIVETIISMPVKTEGKNNMDITFNCPKCNEELTVDQSAAGATANCPACSEPLVVPASTPTKSKRRFVLPPSKSRQSATPLVPPSQPPLQPKRAQGLAIASLVLGIVGVIPLLGLATGLIGLGLGITALVKRTTSMGIAIAGTVLGGLATLMIPIHIGILVGALFGASFAAKTALCAANLKKVGIGIISYQQKHNGEYPATLEVLIKDKLLEHETLMCPLHKDQKGTKRYDYKRPSSSQATDILAWDSTPHRVGDKVVAGRNVVYANGSVQFLAEQQFQEALRAANPKPSPTPQQKPPSRPRSSPDQTTVTPKKKAVSQPPVVSPPPAVQPLTVDNVCAVLQSAPTRDQRRPLQFLAQATVEPERRDAIIAALKPLLNDVDNAELAFQAFANWASTNQVPELIEFVRIAPRSSRGKQSMKILSRLGDARAGEPLAACLSDFQAGRDAKTALVGLGSVAKPAVLPLYHHEDRNARDTARELLRGYGVTDEEIYTTSLQALASERGGTRRSAVEYFTSATLSAEQRVVVASALRPLVTDKEHWVSDVTRLALKKLATPVDADFLLELMPSTDANTRKLAVDLLVEFKEPRVAKPLAVLLADNQHTYWAGDALVRLGSIAESAVVPYLKSEDGETRKRAAEILGRIGTSKSLSALQSLSKDKHFFAKVAAENAVNAIRARPAETKRK